MFIKLLPQQIPQYWDAIKYAARNADRVSESDLPDYLNRLLYSLLSDKAQCFFRIDASRELLAVIITRLIMDELTGVKSLAIQCIYSFKSVVDDEWLVNMNAIESFAINNNCKKVLGYSTNQRIFNLASQLGFSERFRCFVKEV